ncbi:IlvB Thiamine pyrophosphate-requiring enzymes [acetolactate synthase, pyruvate dehydrogenase (cytochrome), glyoxylate carboligase, phosphonopyruvate decarboxylase] [Candidatus Pelagibacterales bacterium]
MTVAEYILKFLISKNVKNVFLMTGGAISFAVDAFSKNKKIKYTCIAHEQSAAMMADAYSRCGKGFGATMVTSGPGAQNLITGIACSWFDSVPVIHISGQVNKFELSSNNQTTKQVRQIGFQETDIVSIVKPITKFAYQLKDSKEIKYILEKAFYIANEGRPGPVLIDIPMNFQKEKIDLNKLTTFKKPKTKNNNIKIKDAVYKVQELLIKSKRPILILGGGVRMSNAVIELEKFLKRINIPIVTTWSGLDLVDFNHKNYIGCIGVYGSRGANFAVQNADLVLNFGSRLDTRITGGKPETFARSAKIISVDIDKYELNKKRGLNVYLKINEDLKNFLSIFNLRSANFRYSASSFWERLCKKWKLIYPNVVSSYKKQKKYVNPYFFIERLSEKLNSKDIIVPCSGGNLTWTIQAFKIKKGQRLFSAYGNSPMGYALPAALGAALANNKQRVICIEGDGGIQINIQELQTMVSNNIPVKLFIINNNGYGIIKQFQELYLGGRYEATIPSKGVTNPDFKKISNAYGINYSEIKNNKEIDRVLTQVLRSKRPEFINVIINSNQKIIPKLQFGKPIEDLSPLLSRSEFQKNMIVLPLREASKNFSEAN